MRQRHSVIFTILTGRDPGHFFEKFKEIGIAGEAEKFLYLGDGPALCQHRLGEVSPLHGDIMPNGGMGMFLEQAPEIVLVQVEFCSNAFQGQWLCQMPVDKGHDLIDVFLGLGNRTKAEHFFDIAASMEMHVGCAGSGYPVY